MPIKHFDAIIAEGSDTDKRLESTANQERRPNSIWLKLPSGAQQTIALELLEAKLGFRFSQRLWAPGGFLLATKAQRAARQSDRRLAYPDDAFMLVDMGAIGYGLAARHTIPANSFLFHYTGVFTSQSASTATEYSFSIQDGFFGEIEKHDNDYDFPGGYSIPAYGIIDAECYRNFAAFMQYAPKPIDLATDPCSIQAQYVFTSAEVMSRVATANAEVTQDCIYIDGLSGRAIVSHVEIQAGTMIAIDYGYGYWATLNRQPELFDSEGQRIEYSEYYPNLIYVKKQSVAAKEVFSALFKQQGLRDLSYNELQSELVAQFGEARYLAHLDCFLKKNPLFQSAYAHSGLFQSSTKPGPSAETQSQSKSGVNRAY